MPSVSIIPDRLMHPLRRIGAKGEGRWQQVSWDDALDEIAEAFVKAEAKDGSEAIWPYYYAGTMGWVQRDSIDRLRHAKRYSGFFSSICTNPAWTGFTMATGTLARSRSARNGPHRLRRHLGHQCGRDPGQRDDARDQVAQGASAPRSSSSTSTTTRR